MSENAFLDYDGLSYYDGKNKSYVDGKISDEATRATDAENKLNTSINNIVNGTSMVAKATSATSATYATTSTKAGTSTYASNAGTATYAKTAPTAVAGTNNTEIANTAFVQTAIANLVDSAPETLNTLNELSEALGDDPNFATTVANRIGLVENDVSKIVDGTTTVGKATTASKAGTATYSTNSGTSTYSSNSAKATSATSATYATTATSAGSASKATSATSATYSSTATYAKSAPTYKGATTSASGTAGLVPAATTATRSSFLRGDGTWAVPSSATSSSMLSINNTENKSDGRLQFFQKSGSTALNPDSGWWSLLRTQHPGYANGYWQEMAYAFGSDTIKFRRNVNGTTTAWKTIAFTDSDITGKAASATYSSTATYSKNSGTSTYSSNSAKATSATSATYATTATSAGSASKATSATSATYATTSTKAGTATRATNADTSTYATSAGTASYASNSRTYKGATTASAGTTGFVPAATTATRTSFLRGDGTWATPSSATSATKATSATYASTAVVDSGGVNINTNYIKNASVSGKVVTFTKGNGSTFSITTQDNNTTYANYKGATTAASGTAGLVPAATTATRTSFLRGDGTWATPSNSSSATYATNSGTSTYSSNSAKASSATSATYASTATKAGTATRATNADTATYATSAGSASKATSATSATYATTATNAGTSNYSGAATYATNSGTSTYSSNGAKATSATSATYATTATKAGTATYASSAPTYKGATTAASGTKGLVPAATTATRTAFLRGDGTWATPTNTQNTAGASNTSSKIFLVGATTQSANPQTYTHDTAYVGTDGCVYSNSKKTLTTANVLSTVAECDASTTSTDIAGASALSELNDSLNNLVTYQINKEMLYGYIVSEDGSKKIPLYCQWLHYEGSFAPNTDVVIKNFTNIFNVRILDARLLLTNYVWYNCQYVCPSLNVNGTTTSVRIRQTISGGTVDATCNVFIVYSKN